MSRRCLVASLTLVLASGCEVFLGPSPINDPPIIDRIGPWEFVANNQVVNRYASAEVEAMTETRWDIEVREPEGQGLALVAGPIPRGWSFDAEARQLVLAPDARQRGLIFTVYVAAEDDRDPPAHDVRTLELWVR